MVTSETGQFKEQLWKTFRAIALTFLVISGIGALIEDRGITKGLLFGIRLLSMVPNQFQQSVSLTLDPIQALACMKRFSRAWIQTQSSVMSRELTKLKLNSRKLFTTYEILR